MQAFPLQMIGLAYEVHDTYQLKQRASEPTCDNQAVLKLEYIKVSPTFTDVMLYSYCYIGLLTGGIHVLF